MTDTNAGTPTDPMRDVLSDRERAQIDAAELLASYAEATETDDAAYLRKHLRRACGLVRTLAARLASAERDRDALREERRAAIAQARFACEEFDFDNSWPDDLYLADVIEKRLVNLMIDLRNATRAAPGAT